MESNLRHICSCSIGSFCFGVTHTAIFKSLLDDARHELSIVAKEVHEELFWDSVFTVVPSSRIDQTTGFSVTGGFLLGPRRPLILQPMCVQMCFSLSCRLPCELKTLDFKEPWSADFQGLCRAIFYMRWRQATHSWQRMANPGIPNSPPPQGLTNW